MRALASSLALLTLASGAAVAASCTPDANIAQVRSLERTGQAALVCLGAPGSSAALRPLGDCTSTIHDAPNDFGGDGTAPHLYVLVLLEARGELAVIDLSTEDGNILDQEPSTPGETSLPIGALPTGITVTPKGTAAFVTSGDLAHPGIYAIPGELLRPCEVDPARCDAPAPTLSTWPACRLDSVPGAITMIADPAKPLPDGSMGTRATCSDTAYTAVDPSGPEFGDIDREGLGRQKLYVTLPKEGAIAVLDAQTLLEAPPGRFDACVIEAKLPLDQPPPEVSPTLFDIEDGPACAVPALPEIRATSDAPSTPSGIALAGDRLFIGDLTKPLIHVVNVTDPCRPVEQPGLAPISFEDPSRVVVTSRLSVSPEISPSLERYLYAIDVEDRSVMVFDVTLGEGSVVPLRRANPELNPLQPPDRVRFAAAPEDVVVVNRDAPKSAGQGLSPFGILCDPRPEAVACTSGSTTCDLGTLYRTSSDYEDGAGPFQMRGTFAMVALASGQIAVIDIEDYDAPCRGPSEAGGPGCPATFAGGVTTDEATCAVTVPHTTRSGVFLLTNDDVGRHQPGVQAFPVLSQDDGTVVTDGPVMRATRSEAGGFPPFVVGGDVLTLDDAGRFIDDDAERSTLVMNLEDPRVHQLDQDWFVTYQGPLPAFTGKRGDLRLSSFDRELLDVSAGFCRGGVRPEAAVREELAATGLAGAALDAAAARLADRVHISQDLTAQSSTYWDNAACSFEQCRATFGDDEAPAPARDLRVLEAREDRLDLAAPAGVTDELFECCFPTLLAYEIRPGDEWLVVGASSGFLHATIADPATGVCRTSCDPRAALRRGRVSSTVLDDPTASIPDTAPTAYHGALFRFAIAVPPPASGRPQPQRDMTFRFSTQGSFIPLRGVLTNEDRPLVLPQALLYSKATDKIIVTDGGLEGVLIAPGDLNGNLQQLF